MRLLRFRASTALRLSVWVLVLLGAGCAPSTAPTPSGSPSSPPTAGGEHNHVTHPGSAPDLVVAEMMAYERALPTLERYCASCHTSKGARATTKTLSHFNMDGYPLGGHHSAEIAETIREVLGASGKKATMPRNDPGVVQGQDLVLILDWAQSFDRAQAAGLHLTEPDDHGHAH